jgi:hypothetical protein
MWYLTQTGNGCSSRADTGASSLARQLEVARDVVGGGNIHTAHTISAQLGEHRVGRCHQLHLAEHTARGQQGLAHVAEHTAARGDQGRGKAGQTVDVRGQTRQFIRARYVVQETSTAIGHRDIVSSVQGNLLQTSLERRHTAIPVSEKKSSPKPFGTLIRLFRPLV